MAATKSRRRVIRIGEVLLARGGQGEGACWGKAVLKDYRDIGCDWKRTFPSCYGIQSVFALRDPSGVRWHGGVSRCCRRFDPARLETRYDTLGRLRTVV